MMPREPHTTTVIVPGLRGHVEDHWQTLLAAKLPNAVVVPSFTRDKRDLAGRVADLHQVISDANTPVTIVAHSAGVLTTVHWALRHDLPVRGALLATPPDLARPLGPLYPSLAELQDSGWLPIPLAPLRFPTIVAASTNDVLGDVEHVRAMARAWGSHLIDIGPVGHLNPAAGYGEWLGAEALLGILNGSVPTHHHTGHVPLSPASGHPPSLRLPVYNPAPGQSSNSLT
ncbi:MAG TPA: alpha/beta hydrolase [Intrasporangium sp.]|nr:alpha/beta hydrolase [Intrasporangium sp.]